MKLFAAAAERNKLPIAEALAELVPDMGLVLEVASGSGQHAAHLASHFGRLDWQPSDVDPRALASIEAYRADAQLPNLLPPLVLDALSDEWPIESAEMVLSINMIHIAPWQACLGLLRGSARLLRARARLVLYGPFAIDGDYVAASNVAFDHRLRAENPEYGVRELRDVESAATRAGFVLERVMPRPANNQIVVFRRVAAALNVR
jgi:SAM-dependent methyltransferase